jgi:serine/threonine-protein kinase
MESIGEYRVVRLVGEGGMGKVYEAEERLSGRRVALKVLRPELTADEEGRRLFTNEMKILAQLEHESLVRSLASFEHEGRLVLVLEFLEGETLRSRLQQRGKLGWMDAVGVAARIAAALEVAHDKGVVHRDLKPENVMLLAASGAVKVMDFGVAKVLCAHTGNVPSQSVGTLQYMSPEQIDAKAIDGRSDLYALGLLLHEMIAGAPPFRSASPRELLNLQCTAAPPALPGEVPRGVRELVAKLLAKEPVQRPANATDVARALAPFLPDPAEPKVEAVVTAAPVREVAATEGPAAAAPSAEAPSTDAHSTDAHSTETPAAERSTAPPTTEVTDTKTSATARTPMPAPKPAPTPKKPAREVAGRKAAVVLLAAGLLSFALTFAVRQQMADGKNFSEAVSSLVKTP